jgi:polysaccharide biosynthesis protein VpsQ
MNARHLAVAFTLFLLLLILAANLGRMPPFVRALHDFPQGDRVGHCVLYGTLAALLARAFPKSVRLGRLALPISVAVLVMFATIEEWSQLLFPSRTADLVDLACGCLGILLGTVAAAKRRAFIGKKTMGPEN